MTIFEDGAQTRAFSYIADVAPVIAKSIELPEATNQIFNVGADTPYTVNELAEVVAGAMGAGEMGAPANVAHLPARNEVQHAFSSHEKARRVFGGAEPASLREGVSRMAAWAQRVGARQSSVFGEIEIRRNLPPSWAQAVERATEVMR